MPENACLGRSLDQLSISDTNDTEFGTLSNGSAAK